MLKFINRILFRFALQPLDQVLYGGTYKVAHIDRTTGKRKVFWCCTWQDAMDWVACAGNDDRVTVTDTAGSVLAAKRSVSGKAGAAGLTPRK